MATLTIHLPDDKHTRLKELAQARGISVSKMIEELSTIALTEFDAQSRFNAISQRSASRCAKRGNPEEGLQLLDKLDSLLSAQNTLS